MKKRRSKLIMISILLITLLVISSYALWTRSYEQTNTNIVEAGCLNIEFEELTSAINLVKHFPITDAEGLKTNPYTLRIENVCDITAEYVIKIEVTDKTTLPLSNVKVAIDQEISILDSNVTGTSSLKKSAVTIADVYVIYTGILYPNQVKTHEVREWLDEDSIHEETANKLMESYVTIDAVTSEKEDNRLATLILAQGGGPTAIESKTVKQNAVPTSVTSGLYAAADDYGTSYYYRGVKNSLNNNLIFAGFQWKIVRINGDGSIRLIYNGTEEEFNTNGTMNTTGKNTAINDGSTHLWNETNRSDPKYSGYMYGGANGVASTSKEEAQKNETNSNIKKEVDKWYELNIKSTEYESYLADTLFCNDRSITNGDGYGTSQTNYGSYTRLETKQFSPIPTLKCQQDADAFTVESSLLSSGITTNGALIYPIGLLTADEAQYAGTAKYYYDKNQYLHTNSFFWLFSPASYDGVGSAYVWVVRSDGALNSAYNANTALSIRIVLNLNSNIQVTGDGSETNPFIVL